MGKTAVAVDKVFCHSGPWAFKVSQVGDRTCGSYPAISPFTVNVILFLEIEIGYFLASRFKFSLVAISSLMEDSNVKPNQKVLSEVQTPHLDMCQFYANSYGLRSSSQLGASVSHDMNLNMFKKALILYGFVRHIFRPVLLLIALPSAYYLCKKSITHNDSNISAHMIFLSTLSIKAPQKKS